MARFPTQFVARLRRLLHSQHYSQAISFALSRAFPVCVALWFVVHGILIVWAVAPLPETHKGRWPWGMFSHAPLHDKRLVVEGRHGDSAWFPLPIDDLFGYRRGATTLRYSDHAHAFRRNGSREERARFANFIAQQSADRGQPVTEVRIFWLKTHIETHRTRRSSLGRYDVEVQHD